MVANNTPSTFHLDLFDLGLAPDPYYRDNLLQFYKYEHWDWTYSTNFSVSSGVLQESIVELVFEGLDTHTDIYLNGEVLGRTNNSHREWVFDVKGKLKSANSLQIDFHSAVNHDLAAEKRMNDTYGIVLPFNYSHSRKPAY